MDENAGLPYSWYSKQYPQYLSFVNAALKKKVQSFFLEDQTLSDAILPAPSTEGLSANEGSTYEGKPQINDDLLAASSSLMHRHSGTCRFPLSFGQHDETVSTCSGSGVVHDNAAAKVEEVIGSPTRGLTVDDSPPLLALRLAEAHQSTIDEWQLPGNITAEAKLLGISASNSSLVSLPANDGSSLLGNCESAVVPCEAKSVAVANSESSGSGSSGIRLRCIVPCHMRPSAISLKQKGGMGKGVKKSHKGKKTVKRNVVAKLISDDPKPNKQESKKQQRTVLPLTRNALVELQRAEEPYADDVDDALLWKVKQKVVLKGGPPIDRGLEIEKNWEAGKGYFSGSSSSSGSRSSVDSNRAIVRGHTNPDLGAKVMERQTVTATGSRGIQNRIEKQYGVQPNYRWEEQRNLAKRQRARVERDMRNRERLQRMVSYAREKAALKPRVPQGSDTKVSAYAPLQSQQTPRSPREKHRHGKRRGRRGKIGGELALEKTSGLTNPLELPDECRQPYLAASRHRITRQFIHLQKKRDKGKIENSDFEQRKDNLLALFVPTPNAPLPEHLQNLWASSPSPNIASATDLPAGTSRKRSSCAGDDKGGAAHKKLRLGSDAVASEDYLPYPVTSENENTLIDQQRRRARRRELQRSVSLTIDKRAPPAMRLLRGPEGEGDVTSEGAGEYASWPFCDGSPPLGWKFAPRHPLFHLPAKKGRTNNAMV